MKVKNGNLNIEIRSIEVQEIVGKAPHWIVTYGTLLIIFAALLFGAVSNFIELPVKVSITASLFSDPESVTIKSPANGYITALEKADSAMLSPGDRVLVIADSHNKLYDTKTPFVGQLWFTKVLRMHSAVFKNDSLFVIVPQTKTFGLLATIPSGIDNYLRKGSQITVEIQGYEGANLILSGKVTSILQTPSGNSQISLAIDEQLFPVVNRYLRYLNKQMRASMEIPELKESLLKRIFKFNP